jgi:GNAT superfamily N-acetyltransferase
MLGWVEERLGALAASHPPAKARQFQVSARQGEEGLHALLQRSGYQPARYFDEMVRPDLEDVPDLSLPAGLELRPVQPDHYPAIWTCIDVTSRDEWGYRPQDAEDYKNWLGDEVRFQPELWQIAWEAGTGTVAGTVLTFIDHRENEAHGRTRGYTEGIGVIPGWRNRGVASTLIARSLFALKAVGMTEAALNVDTDNGSVRLYQRCGFYTVRRDIVYRKAL